MTDPRSLSIKDYTYVLPEDRIASYPLAERDASKLLIYKEGEIKVDRYHNLADHLPEDSLLIFNNTKVVAARLLFQKPSGGMIEIFCLEPYEHNTGIATAMQQKGKVRWKCLVGGASKWKKGRVLEKKIGPGNYREGYEITLHAGIVEKKVEFFIIELSWMPASLCLAEVLQQAGKVPLPPYIKRETEASDTDRYQTMYASSEGSVAAPTAGLHFSDQLFKNFKKKKIQSDFITLHVGAGTFKPVKADAMAGHVMHAEWIEVTKTCIEHILNNPDKNIIAVGTTSLRTIESLYWLGRKPEIRSFRDEMENNSGDNEPELPSWFRVSQWEPYDLPGETIPVKDALQYLLIWMEKHNMERLITQTQLLIAPGYSFKIVKGLITNFHQPHSTLLLLVAAFTGQDPAGKDAWKRVYEYAMQNDFRFLSYGDGCLLWKGKD